MFLELILQESFVKTIIAERGLTRMCINENHFRAEIIDPNTTQEEIFAV